uniref:Cathepsin L-like cysteine protease n=1 Tax=Uronema marinum TaxID=35107 RepID=Q58HF6_UROMR|nr:cathepsin L-like cysteine protease [Uronema marinum]
MKTAAILLVLLALAGTSLFFQENQQTSLEATAFGKFKEWKQNHNLVYSSSEDAYRFQVYFENFQFVEEFNANNSFTLGVENQFAAMTNEEFKAQFTSEIISEGYNYQQVDRNVYEAVNAPSGSVNWVSKGAVQGVQNQGVCGSCWAFSAVCSLERLYKINTGKLLSFSEQQLVSCEPKSYGCDGGWPEAAFAYSATHGLESSASYPYVQQKNGKTASCQYNSSKATKGINKSYKNVAANSPDSIYNALVKQPLSILVDASSSVFQHYGSGVINSTACGTTLNHAINVVGYSGSVWTLRNSWGTTWGEKGYARVQYSTGAGYCGMNRSASYPTN